MVGYPITYGDTLDNGRVSQIVTSRRAKAVAAGLVLIGSRSVAYAADPVCAPAYDPQSLDKIAKVTFAVSCYAGGWLCSEATKNVPMAPHVKAAAAACIAATAWCAAKASPL